MLYNVIVKIKTYIVRKVVIMSNELNYSEVVDVIESYMRELEAVMDGCETVYSATFVKSVQRHHACNVILDLLKTKIKENEFIKRCSHE